ncbi:MAG TPA: hypothetical protein VGB78_06010 [Thermoplasmata archaeon]
MQKKISELQNAELKFRALLNKRDEINEQATILRSERDTLNDQKAQYQDQLRDARDRRNELVRKMKVHKAKRDDFQAKAKELIEFKKKLRGRQVGSLKDEIRALEAEARAMDVRQQTVPLSIPKERELIDQMKKKLAEVERLKKVFVEQDKIHREIKDLDASIDALFRQADKEHEQVVKLAEEQHKAHEEATAAAKEIATLTATADKKHQGFLKLREGADAAHQKAMDMREKIIEIKGAKRAERVEERRMVKEINLAAKQALDDRGKRDKVAQDALEILLKKGKVEIR